jgi:hypothetical protein
MGERYFNIMRAIKKWEQFSMFLAIGIICAGFFFKSVQIQLVILSFGILIQIYIFFLYKEQNMMSDYLKRKLGAILVGILLIGFFLVKNTGGF